MSEQVKIKRTIIERGVRLGGGNERDIVPANVLAVESIKQKRDQEKQELNRLNERFAVYVQRVKFLEEQNLKLLDELDLIRQSWGEGSRKIKEQYEPILHDARVNIDEITKEKSLAEIRSKRAEYDAANYKRQHDDTLNLINFDRAKIKNLEQLIEENRVELELLRNQINDAESDINKYQNEIRRLNADLQDLLAKLDEETLRRVQLENEKQTLQEQIPFINAIHEQQVAEFRALQAGAHIDPAQFYRHELEKAIRDIRGDFEALNEQQKRELEEWYRLKTEEIIEQAKKHDLLNASLNDSSADLEQSRSQYAENARLLESERARYDDYLKRLNLLEEHLDELRRKNGQELSDRERLLSELIAQINNLRDTYDELMHNKTSLEFEINTYRRLLESEESRVKTVSGSSASGSSSGNLAADTIITKTTRRVVIN